MLVSILCLPHYITGERLEKASCWMCCDRIMKQPPIHLKHEVDFIVHGSTNDLICISLIHIPNSFEDCVLVIIVLLYANKFAFG